MHTRVFHAIANNHLTTSFNDPGTDKYAAGGISTVIHLLDIGTKITHGALQLLSATFLALYRPDYILLESTLPKGKNGIKWNKKRLCKRNERIRE